MDRKCSSKALGVVLGCCVLFGNVLQAQQAGTTGPLLTPGMMGMQEAVPADMADEDASGLAGFLKGIEGAGFINAAYSYNLNDSERSTSPGPETPLRIMDTFHNEFTVHQVALYLEKAVDDDNLVGFEFTPMVGKDAIVSSDDSSFNFNNNDIDIWAANVKMYIPDDIAVLGGTELKFGKFETIIGAEVLATPYNTMFSRTLLFGLGTPRVHTGGLATKTLVSKDDGSSLLDFKLAMTNGWGAHNVGSQNNGGNFPNWIVGATLAPGDMFDLTANYSVGEISAAGQYRTLVDLVGNVTIGDLGINLNFDWAEDQAGNPSTGGYGAYWGTAGIIRYDFAMTSSKKNWYIAGRGEYYDDMDGVTIQGDGIKIYDLSGAIGYQPFESLLLRTEARFDKADQDVYESGSSNNQTTLSFDASYLF